MIKKDFFINIHPGELLEGILLDEGISQSALSRALGCHRKVVSEICNKKRGISAEMAFKLSHVLGQSPIFWMNAQSNWELSQVNKSVVKKVHKLVGFRAA